MGNKAFQEVINLSKTKAEARLILLALADRSNDNGESFPSKRELCRYANVSKPTIDAYLKTFQHIGLVSIEPRYRMNGGRSSNLYRINFEMLGKDEISAAMILNAKPLSKKTAHLTLLDQLTSLEGGTSNDVTPPPSNMVRGEINYTLTSILTNDNDNDTREEKISDSDLEKIAQHHTRFFECAIMPAIFTSTYKTALEKLSAAEIITGIENAAASLENPKKITANYMKKVFENYLKTGSYEKKGVAHASRKQPNPQRDRGVAEFETAAAATLNALFGEAQTTGA